MCFVLSLFHLFVNFYLLFFLRVYFSRWEIVELPNHATLWELALDARGKMYNIFELQFDANSLALHIAKEKAGVVAEQLQQQKQHSSETVSGKGRWDDSSTDNLTTPDASSPSRNAILKHDSEHVFRQSVISGAETGTKTGMEKNTSGTSSFSSSLLSSARLGSLNPLLDVRTSAKKISENIIKRQVRKIRDVSYQRLRDTGLLDEHLRAMEKIKSTSVSDPGGWFSTKMLLLYIAIYIFALGSYFTLQRSVDQYNLIETFNRASELKKTPLSLSDKEKMGLLKLREKGKMTQSDIESYARRRKDREIGRDQSLRSPGKSSPDVLGQVLEKIQQQSSALEKTADAETTQRGMNHSKNDSEDTIDLN